jgi:VanZ family protein
VTAPAVDRRGTTAFVAVVLLRLVVLFWPRTPSEESIPNLDKLVHAGLFALLAATTWWRFAGHRAGLVSVLLYAVASEVIQSTVVTTRDGDLRDVAADASGALLGWLFAKRLTARRER